MRSALGHERAAARARSAAACRQQSRGRRPRVSESHRWLSRRSAGFGGDRTRDRAVGLRAEEVASMVLGSLFLVLRFRRSTRHVDFAATKNKEQTTKNK